MKFGVSCDGYRVLDPAPAKKALLPSQSGPLHILPVTALFKDQMEYQYWLFFRDEVAHELSGNVPKNCWEYVVLQTCNTSPILRDLTVAIAALSKSSHNFTPSNTHHQYAVRKYGQALRSIQEMVSSHSDFETIRTTLIASLLIFSFETMHGNSEQAIEHAKASLTMMRKKLNTSSRKYSQIQRFLPLSPSIPGLEDEVLEVFVHLDQTIRAATLDDPYRKRSSFLDMTFIDEHLHMPSSFLDLAEAKGYLEHFLNKAMPYLSHLTDAFLYGDKFAYQVPESEYEILNAQLQQWYRSFKPLFERACQPGDKDFIGAAALRCLALGTDISIQRVCLRIGSRPKEVFEAEAREIVDLTRRAVLDPRFKKSFGFDCGLVPSLFIVVMICWNREIREEAISVLKMAEGRIEVVWDASKIAELGEMRLKAEEQAQTVLVV